MKPAASAGSDRRQSTRVSAWLIGPLVAAVGIAGLLFLVPTQGRAVHVRWREDVSADQREELERRLHLVNPTDAGDGYVGYVLDDTSPAHVRLLIGQPEIEGTRYVIDGPPLRLSGPFIIRMAGPFAVQSLVCLIVGVLLLRGSYAPSVRWRQWYVASACVLFGIACVAAELPVRASHDAGAWMGDYDTYTMDRQHFRDYFGFEAVRFQHHLGGFVLQLIDRGLGATNASPQNAFLVMSWLAGAVFLGEAVAIALLERWSPLVMRYLSLCFAAPLALSFFGYRELGYLSLSLVAFPLLLKGITHADARASHKYLATTAMLQGLRSALHGFGLFSLAGSLLAVVAVRGALWSRAAKVATIFVWGFSAYLIWLLLYLTVLALPIVPGHAAGVAFRRLLEPYAAERRIVAPIVSVDALRDIGLEALIVGVPILVVGLLIARRSEDWRVAAAFAVPSVACWLLFWPVQGIGVDMDLVFAGFPAFFAGAWLCARHPAAAGMGLALLALGHAIFWLVVRHPAFTNVRG